MVTKYEHVNPSETHLFVTNAPLGTGINIVVIYSHTIKTLEELGIGLDRGDTWNWNGMELEWNWNGMELELDWTYFVPDRTYCVWWTNYVRIERTAYGGYTAYRGRTAYWEDIGQISTSYAE